MKKVFRGGLHTPRQRPIGEWCKGVPGKAADRIPEVAAGGAAEDAAGNFCNSRSDGKRLVPVAQRRMSCGRFSEREGFLGDFCGKRIRRDIPAETANVFRSIRKGGKLFSPVPRELPLMGRGSTPF
ncbi:MAG: hypothetical protein ACLU7M_03440 [Mediterraneibacter gnavus]